MTIEAMDPLADFNSAMAHLAARGIHQGLEPMQQAVAALGHPERQFKIVHVAGTNGKGSTCTFLAQILAHSSYRVGLTLSPHVFDFSERIQCSVPSGGLLRPIPDLELAALHARVTQLLPPSLELTYFEYSTLLALEYFAEQKVDIAVIETGLGGRWDATNVCESAVAAITTIGLDHTAILGPTRAAILAEKLEIIKNAPAFLFGPDDPELLQIAQQYCQKRGTHFYRPSDLLTPEMHPKNLGDDGVLNGYLKNNWLFAVALAKLLQFGGMPLNDASLKLSPDVQIPPARLQIFSRHPLIMLDGAHNAEALGALKVFLDDKFGGEYDVIFGCLQDRDFLALARLIQSPRQNYWARFASPGRVTPDSIYAKVLRELGGKIVTVDADFAREFASLSHERPVTVCGSFHLCCAFAQAFSGIYRRYL